MSSDPLDQKLRQLMGEISTVAPPPPAVGDQRARRKPSRNPHLGLLAAAAALLVVAVGFGALALRPDAPQVVVETSAGLGQSQPDVNPTPDVLSTPLPEPAAATSLCPPGFPVARDTDRDGVIDTCYADEAPTAVPAPPIVQPSFDSPASGEEPFYHMVKSGDRLSSIAMMYNVTVDVIIRANPQLDPNLIIAGERLLIPGTSTTSELLGGPDRPDGVTVNYVVQAGDTLGSIATTWTVSLEALLAANPIVDAASLQVNQVLLIPPRGTGLDASDEQPRGAGDPLEHVIEVGDFISAIAQQYGVTIQQIVDANDLEDGGNSLQVGQILLIPPPDPSP